jgi:hypothetical protein
MKDLNTQLEVANTIYGQLVVRLDLFASDEHNAPVIALIEKQLAEIDRLERTLAIRAEVKAMRKAA